MVGNNICSFYFKIVKLGLYTLCKYIINFYSETKIYINFYRILQQPSNTKSTTTFHPNLQNICTKFTIKINTIYLQRRWSCLIYFFTNPDSTSNPGRTIYSKRTKLYIHTHKAKTHTHTHTQNCEKRTHNQIAGREEDCSVLWFNLLKLAIGQTA